MVKGKERLIVAIDTNEFDKAKELIDELDDSVDIFKVGLEQYVSTRGKTIDYLKEKGKKIFLDLKFHDIPNTMKSAVRSAVRDNVWLMTIHVSDLEGMRQCALVAKEEAEKLNIEKPLIVGVTVLTSLSNQDLKDIGCDMTTEELAIKRAKLAKESGIDGIVCSAQEVDKIIQVCGDDFVTVCPGIRPTTSEVGDQKRVVTPSEAINKGAQYLVIGRPITQAINPKQSAINIVKEIESVL
ncbi:orotidine-5'-phosphate decarboxylase [Romboutsia maritimum]|uniref:Orotidine 5'-phosphate decarboxylase n=1 Tax=Romboutsia maritimum TaxID=2020948 RepID=A0A371IRA2_9FIRM|nr:orotidine-5'-phosphate decarboxylase [Romboutsia maritimum]RDY23011.1 orotidine-5'-phosphate decarboxylase [Romboutsia maritimum]